MLNNIGTVASPPKRSIPRVVITILTLLGMVLVGWLLWATVVQASCTVGIEGSAATITLQGITAPQICSFVTQNGYVIPAGGASIMLYPYQGNPTGNELCSLNQDVPEGGFHYSINFTVRDTGMVPFIGDEACMYLQQHQITDPTAPQGPNGP